MGPKRNLPVGLRVQGGSAANPPPNYPFVAQLRSGMRLTLGKFYRVCLGVICNLNGIPEAGCMFTNPLLVAPICSKLPSPITVSPSLGCFR